MQLQPCRLPTGPADKKSRVSSPPTGPATKNLKFPDCRGSPVAFQLDLAPNKISSSRPAAFQLDILIWKLEIFWWQAQLEGDRATIAIWELEIFC